MSKRKKEEEIFSPSRYTYYYPEDGECSLDNPIVWQRLETYIYRLVKFTPYITEKHAINATDVLLQVKENLGHLKPFQYGDEHTDPITFLIKKINTQTGREWWRYLKNDRPLEYARLRELSRVSNKDRYHERKRDGYFIESGKKLQKNNRDKINISYLCSLIYHDLRNSTGVKYSFEEIKIQFPYLIEQKRETIIAKRGQPKQLPELTDAYLTRMVRDKLARRGIKREKYEVTALEKEEMKQSILTKRAKK